MWVPRLKRGNKLRRSAMNQIPRDERYGIRSHEKSNFKLAYRKDM